MEDQELLEVLEKAYAKGVPLDYIRTVTSDEQYKAAEEFFLKKKDSTGESSEEVLSVSESGLVPNTTESLSSPVNSDSEFILSGGLNSLQSAYEKGMSIDYIRENFSDRPGIVSMAEQYYKSESARKIAPPVEGLPGIIPEAENELARLYNSGVAPGLLANVVQQAEISGEVPYEKIAYLNSVIQENAPREEDYLYDTSNAVGSFVLDVIRVIPQSLISMVSAKEAGVRGAAALGATGAGVGSVVPGIGTALGATTGATAGYFGAASLAIEYASSISDVLREEGIDVTKADQLAFAFEDEKIMERAREKGLKRGIPIGIFDAISGGVAGKVGTSVVKALGKTTTNRAVKILGAEAASQGLLGGTGELAGQVISGEEIRPRDIALEAFAELGPAGPAMAYNLSGRLNATPGELRYADVIKATANQKDLVESSNAVDAIPEMSKLNSEIAAVSAIQPVDKNEARVKKQSLRELRDKKYDLKTTLSENYLALEQEQKGEVNGILELILANEATIQTEGVDPRTVETLKKDSGNLQAQIREILTGDQELTTSTTEEEVSNPNEIDLGENETIIENREVIVKGEKLNLTIIEQTSEKDGIKTTKYQSNRSNKSSDQRGDSSVSPETVLNENEEINLEENGLEDLEDGGIPEITKVFEVREDDNGTKAADIEFTVTYPDGTKVSDRGTVKITESKTSETEVQSSSKDMSSREGTSYDLYNPQEVEDLRRAMDEGEFRAGARAYLENMLLASESYKKSIPGATKFAIGFGREGYQSALVKAGFGVEPAGKRSAGKTAVKKGTLKNVGRIAVEVPTGKELAGEGQTRGPGEKFTGIQTAYHEIFHNILNDHFKENVSDYNQLRKLVIRQLAASDVRQLNDFATRYEGSLEEQGTLQSEEFMVQLGGLLANKNITFDPTFLEQLKAYIGNILRKITGGNINFGDLTEAALAQDLANYMKGTAETMRLGGDARTVTKPESLRTERFQRTKPQSTFGPDGELVDLVEAKNQSGLIDPDNYEKTLSPFDELLSSITKGVSNKVKSLESKTNVGLRRTKGAILSAQEFNQSANVPYLNLLAVRLKGVRKITAKMTPEQRQEVQTAASNYFFSEDAGVQTEAFRRLQEINSKLADDMAIMNTVREFYQGQFDTNPMYDILPDEMVDIIKGNSKFYGTLTYRAFTDPDFEFNSKLAEAAEEAMVNLNLMDETFYLQEQLELAPEGLNIIAQMKEMGLNHLKSEDIVKYVDAKKKSLNKEIKDLSKSGNTSGVVTATDNLQVFSEKDIAQIKEEIDAGVLAEEIQREGFDFRDDAQVENYVEKTKSKEVREGVQKYIKDIRIKANNISGRNTQSDEFRGDDDLGGLRVPTKSFKGKQDLPQELRDYLGEEKDAFIKFTTTVNNLANIYGKFGLVDKVNRAGKNAGIGDLLLTSTLYNAVLRGNYLTDSKGEQMYVLPSEASNVSVQNLKELIYNSENFGLKNPQESLTEFFDRIDIEYTQKIYYKQYGSEVEIIEPTNYTEFRKLNNALDIYFQENFTIVKDRNSPMNGQAIRNDFVQALKMTPLYASKNKGMQAYYAILLQMRRTRVLYNLPTWRKNIMGGYYFLAANGILPVGDNLGGYNVIKDLNTRFKKIRKGEYTDPVLIEQMETAARYGLLGSSVSASLFDDINQSFFAQMNGDSSDKAWAWLGKAKEKSKRIAYQYGAIDDYTKLVGFLVKRENFAKRLASNPDGKSFSELSPQEQNEVNEMTAERIKQTFPTMSRIHPSFRLLMQSPFGDFLSFRLESFRSFFAIYKNAVNDIKEGATNQSLTPSQRQAYVVDGTKSVTMGAAMAAMSAIGYSVLANLVRGDDDETKDDLSVVARGTNMILPVWMQGANILPIKMEKNGDIRFVNMSSEDPYDEIQGLIYKRDGVQRLDQIENILGDFLDPNMAVGMMYNVIQGKNQYGEPIQSSEDLNWFYRNIIGPSYVDWDKALGTYVLKEVFIPPNIAFIERTLRKRAKEIEKAQEEGLEPELEPLNAVQLASNLVFRDYPINIAQQFYWNLKDMNLKDKWSELPENRKTIREARLMEIKQAYEFGVTYGETFENYDLIEKFEKSVRQKFRGSYQEIDYILYDVPLDE